MPADRVNTQSGGKQNPDRQLAAQVGRQRGQPRKKHQQKSDLRWLPRLLWFHQPRLFSLYRRSYHSSRICFCRRTPDQPSGPAASCPSPRKTTSSSRKATTPARSQVLRRQVSSLLTIIPKNIGQCSIGLVPSVRHKCTPSPRKFSND